MLLLNFKYFDSVRTELIFLQVMRFHQEEEARDKSWQVQSKSQTDKFSGQKIWLALSAQDSFDPFEFTEEWTASWEWTLDTDVFTLSWRDQP